MNSTATTVDTRPAIGRAGEHATAAAASGPRFRLWDLPLRLFHWALVAAVTTAWVTAQVGGEWMKVHGAAGIAVVGLVAFRLVWGLLGPRTARFASFAPTPRGIVAYLKGRWQGVGHNPLGALSVFALLALLAFQATSGLFANDDIAFTGPFAAQVDEALSARLTGWHHLVADALLWLVGLHVVAIAAYAVFKRTNLVRPMVTGWQQAKPGQPVPPPGSQRVRRWALLLAVAVGLGAAFLASGLWWPQDPAPAPTASQQAAPPAAW